jgi:uncharacterized SAM-dependent methyltransferase
MEIKRTLLKELIKNGYSKESNSRVWNIGSRSFLYINKEMAEDFLNLKNNERYKKTIIDAEIQLLKDHSPKFLECIEDCKFNLIDMACSDGEKAKTIITSIPKTTKLRYCPVNVNNYLVKLATDSIKNENFPNVLDHAPRISKNFESLDQIGPALRNNTYQKNVYLLLGSILSSFDINHYLFRLSNSMLPGDIIIIGNAIRVGERFENIETYQQEIFHNWLFHSMKKLGFSNDEVTYEPRFANNRLEAIYHINSNKVISHDKQSLELRKGDKVIVAFQYKYFEFELLKFCKMYFENVELVKDKDNEHALIFCKK